MSSDSQNPEGRDYRDTIFLPKSDFPMRAGLPMKEPEWLEKWARQDIYNATLQARADEGAKPFIYHDGPPYANGNLHLGHALNKILKDLVCRSQNMLGKRTPFIPGWDCHGLPIEWKIEEQIRAEGKTKEDVSTADFRQRCRDFAKHWVDVQREEFKRLGVSADWDNPYLTMTEEAEAAIAAEFQKFLMDGSLYRGAKPVMWSVIEKTALAEAEVEYHDHKSITIFVRFPVVKTDNAALEGTSIVIWTTTPWTIPGNRAIAASSKIEYGIYEVGELGEHSKAVPGEKIVLADALAESVRTAARIESWERVGDAGDVLGTICAHPFAGSGYDFDVPVLDGDHVTTETGTGFVHTAPGHGVEDYEVCQKHGGIEIPFTVEADGTFAESVPLFAGEKVLSDDAKDWPANIAVLRQLAMHEKLLAKGKITHSYPHSWRSKAPVIFRNTPQWFISMDTTNIRAKALAALKDVEFFPPQGRNRITAMVEQRPDWLVSRQRAWGVPLTVFVNKQTGEPLRDAAVNTRIIEAFKKGGADVWFTEDPQVFLGDDYQAQDYEQITDILDVWFDSGSTHSFVLNDDQVPADLYLEGSDQHRGWFQSSLLESCGTRGIAPYKALATHGFLLADDGRKMSKSLNNQVEPQDVIKQNGADILRLWVSSSAYSDDVRVGPEMIKTRTDAYRKLRNTMRFMLGALEGFSEDERLPEAEMPELERYMLHRLTELDHVVRDGYAKYDFARVWNALFNFCTQDLSALYLDIRKDALYCDRLDSNRRRACRTVLDQIFNNLTRWLAPMLVFTMEEVWQTRYPDENDSVHLKTFLDVPAAWEDKALAAKWGAVLKLRRVVTGALEIERREKRIGSSLEAAPAIYVTDSDIAAILPGLDVPELAIVSGAEIIEGEGPQDAFRLNDVPGIAVVPNGATGEKCGRCWMVLPDVGANPAHEALCGRCADAVETLDAGKAA